MKSSKMTGNFVLAHDVSTLLSHGSEHVEISNLYFPFKKQYIFGCESRVARYRMVTEYFQDGRGLNMFKD